MVEGPLAAEPDCATERDAGIGKEKVKSALEGREVTTGGSKRAEVCRGEAGEESREEGGLGAAAGEVCCCCGALEAAGAWLVSAAEPVAAL